MTFKIGEIVWFWPEGWTDTLPPRAAVVTATMNTPEYGLHVFNPPGVYDKQDILAVDASHLPDGATNARFRRPS